MWQRRPSVKRPSPLVIPASSSSSWVERRKVKLFCHFNARSRRIACICIGTAAAAEHHNCTKNGDSSLSASIRPHGFFNMRVMHKHLLLHVKAQFRTGQVENKLPLCILCDVTVGAALSFAQKLRKLRGFRSLIKLVISSKDTDGKV